MGWYIVLEENKLTDIVKATIENVTYKIEEIYKEITGKKLSEFINNKKANEIVNEIETIAKLFLDKETHNKFVHDEFEQMICKEIWLILNSIIFECYRYPDATLEFDSGNDEILLKQRKYADVTVAEIGNYTYNVSNMYREAMGITLSDLHGMSATEAIDILHKGVTNMNNDPEKYKAMNPPNGWGDYEGALQFLTKILNACIENPNAYIKVN